MPERDSRSPIAEWLDARTEDVRRQLDVWPDGALIVVQNVVDGSVHRSFGATIKLALDAPIRLETPSGSVLETVAAVTSPGAAHRVDARGTVFVDMIVDPECDEYERIAGCFPVDSGVASLEPTLAEELVRQVRLRLVAGESGASVWDRVVDRLGREPGAARSMDRRVRETARHLKLTFRDGWRLTDLAERVGLSAGRLRHLFSKEMGVSIQLYVTWLRLRDVVYAVVSGHSLTQAAQDAGFADQAHLTRTFRATFGEPPSVLVPREGRTLLNFDATRARPASPHAEADAERIEQLMRRKRG